MRRRIPTLCADAARWIRSASGNFLIGAGTRLDNARIDAQPPFARRHLLAGNQTDRGGGRLMRIFWTLLRRELAAYFCSITGYVIIAAVTLLIGLSFVVDRKIAVRWRSV